MRAGALRVAAAAVVALSACETPPPRPSFEVTIDVHSDDGTALAGVALAAGDLALGKTGPDGRLTVTLHVADGTRLSVTQRCPDGFDPAAPGAPLVLRSFVGLDRRARGNRLVVSLVCRPRERTVAVVVRAAGHAGLPVLVDGEPVGRTNAAGVAHVAVRRPSNTRFRVALDTSSRPRLRPQNPEAPFVVAQADDLFVFDQRFEQRKRRRRRRRRKRKVEQAAPARPVKIESASRRRWRSL